MQMWVSLSVGLVGCCSRVIVKCWVFKGFETAVVNTT